MLNLGTKPMYLYGGHADMRRSFSGLSDLVSVAFPGQLLTGSLFIFLNRRRTMIKMLYWDEDGLAVWAKQLEAGTFRAAGCQPGQISRRELMLVMEGISPKRMNRRFSPDK